MGHWDDFLEEIKEHGLTAEDLLSDLYQLITFEEKEIGEIHSLSLKVHMLQSATNQLLFGEGLFEAEEIMDWTVEMLEILEQEEDQALHFVLELEAAEKAGKKWVAKHHDKVLSEIEIEKLSEDHFIKKVQTKLNELTTIYNKIKDDLETSDQQRIGTLIQAVLHGMAHLEDIPLT